VRTRIGASRSRISITNAKAVEREGVKRDFFADAAPFDHKAQGIAVYRTRGHTVDRAAAGEFLAIAFKPVARVPVLRLQLTPKRKAVAGHIEIAPPLELQMNVVHAQEIDLLGAGRKKPGPGWTRIGHARDTLYLLSRVMQG